MSSTITFYAPSKFAVQVQNLVKRYGGYFVHNPAGVTHLGVEYSKNAQFKISFEDTVSPEDYKAFNLRTHILNQPWV